MKKSMKFATALAGAAVVVVGGTAFTANLTGMQAEVFAGSGATTVSGVTVTGTTYTYTTETGTLDKIVFATSDTVVAADNTITSTLAFKVAADEIVTCTTDAVADASALTCDYTGSDPETIDSIALKVLPKTHTAS